MADREAFTIDLLYGDQDGGQRTVSRCLVVPAGDGGSYGQIARHWNVDRADPPLTAWFGRRCTVVESPKVGS